MRLFQVNLFFIHDQISRQVFIALISTIIRERTATPLPYFRNIPDRSSKKKLFVVLCDNLLCKQMLSHSQEGSVYNAFNLATRQHDDITIICNLSFFFLSFCNFYWQWAKQWSIKNESLVTLRTQKPASMCEVIQKIFCQDCCYLTIPIFSTFCVFNMVTVMRK